MGDKIEKRAKWEKFWQEFFNIKTWSWIISTGVLGVLSFLTFFKFDISNWVRIITFGLCLLLFVLFQILFFFGISRDDY